MESTQSPYGDDITWHIYVGTIATIIPATLAVILRFIARRVSGAGLWWDDYTIAIALVRFGPFCLFASYQHDRYTDSVVGR